LRYDIHNPTPARRVIHDGIEGSQRPITIEAGGDRKNVALSDAVAKDLMARAKAAKDAEVVLTPCENNPPEPEQRPLDQNSSAGMRPAPQHPGKRS
jgi:hypothetical protein